jgi:hypothetical protein
MPMWLKMPPQQILAVEEKRNRKGQMKEKGAATREGAAPSRCQRPEGPG